MYTAHTQTTTKTNVIATLFLHSCRLLQVKKWMTFASPWHHLPKSFQVKCAHTLQIGANRWKTQVTDWLAVSSITPGGAKWQCSDDNDGTSEVWARRQAQRLQTQTCCSHWPGNSEATFPVDPDHHTTPHQHRLLLRCYCSHSTSYQEFQDLLL